MSEYRLLIFLLISIICVNIVFCDLLRHHRRHHRSDSDNDMIDHSDTDVDGDGLYVGEVNGNASISSSRSISSSSISNTNSISISTSSISNSNSNKKEIIYNRRRGQRQRINIKNVNDFGISNDGAWPPVLNVASKALISVNATCGENDREEYCKMTDAHPHRPRATQCGYCDANSSDKSHPIEYAIDGSNRWWQSPSLHMGKQFEYITITLDLRQIYQVIFVIVKSAISPRPASWILERSLDGVDYFPWQYFGASDTDCRQRYGLSAHHGQYYDFPSDSTVICSTKFSKPIPLVNGEMDLSLVNGRPGANTSSTELLDFTIARYVRFRLQGMQATMQADNNVEWLVDDEALMKRSFYSLRHIKIGARLMCSGHAISTRPVTVDGVDDMIECECMHNTCGSNCENCCPLYHQRPFRFGIGQTEYQCEKCECYGHSVECYYNPEVDQKGLSINTEGIYSGGGVCINCTDFTSGINCEKCIPEYYRPYDVSPFTKNPCIPCDCDPIGSEGPCNPIGGQCKCRKGFSGSKCSDCDVGFKGDLCTKCACDIRGTMEGGECESHCQCKLHAEGKYCDRCLSGYFGLNANNPEGCMKCYCSGVASSCRSTVISEFSHKTLENWKVTDISKSIFGYPSRDNETKHLVFGMYELADTESVYWLAPKSYTGNLLKNYGSNLIAKLAWIIVRGDTSGKPTSGPSVILIGKNGMKIAFGDNTFKSSNTTISVTMTEDGWYHVPRSVKDIKTRLRRTEYRGDPVTRVQFMSVLSDVESLLIRGTFHTDQVESVMIEVLQNTGFNERFKNEFNMVEECECPVGYGGRSCEKCEFGYARMYENSTSHERLGKCIPCGCNNHAETCDLESGDCNECLHNTFGDRCERCMVGYYGNAMYGSESDCMQCACPLTVLSNNFSPHCQLKELSLDLTNDLGQDNFSTEYVCTQCPIGYIGDHCEECDDGYFGDPTVIGSTCQPCSCAGGPCDRETGRCISCLGNTEGWRCERCKAGYWGDPLRGCELCNCYQNGSISNVCDATTGQCICNPRYGGHHCDECEFGFGNTTLDCPPCGCNVNGSVDTFCDTQTGQCPCKMGIEGLKCDTCMDTYFELSSDGCEECRCNPYGSLHRSCNRQSGQCFCRANVTGQRCDRCIPGYWNLESNNGCRACRCSTTGSHDNHCNSHTGQCNCRPGVGGLSCDQCLDGFYEFSSNGCKKCDLCPNSAYICDEGTGRCVCPSLSKGTDCQQCFPNSWGWEHRKGCKICDCDHTGAIGQSCDLYTGACICREGYTGRRCDECAPGYYGYPDCQRCNCNSAGSVSNNGDVIVCDDFGQCPCKSLVTGLNCDQCRRATFGLTERNPAGCTRCFCFGRSQDCVQSDLTWGQIRSHGARNLSVEYFALDYEYVIVVQMEDRKMYEEDSEIEIMFGLHLIPSSSGNVSIGARKPFQVPLYFQLPPQFFGDQTKSYGGFLRYTVNTVVCDIVLDANTLKKFPLVQIHAHNNLILDYYGPQIFDTSSNVTYIVGINETHWRYHFNGLNITRAIMMTALQNVKRIFVRGTSWADFTQVVLSNVQMDTGIYISGSKNHIALGVESCTCLEQYNGSSCQNPANGYYRWKNVETDEQKLEEFIGIAVPCNCNGRSEICDTESGYCQNCRNYTGGQNCQTCAEGYYGDPDYSGCNPCPCPETSRNFARGCTVSNGQVSCICKHGYTGLLCDQCMRGFFGSTQGTNGKCESCDCNIDGIMSHGCDEITGQCNCRPGISGRRCDKCEQSRHMFQERQCKICDNCTLTLLDRTDELMMILEFGANHIDLNGIPAPWPRLLDFDNSSVKLNYRLNDFRQTRADIENFNDDVIEKLQSKATNINHRVQKLLLKADKRNHGSEHLRNEAGTTLSEINQMKAKIYSTIDSLNQYGTHDHHINLPMAVNEAQYLLESINTKAANEENARDILKCARKSLNFWSNTSEILSHQMGEVDYLKSAAQNLISRLDDTTHNLYKTNNILDRAIDAHGMNLQNFKILSDKNEQVQSLNKEIFGLTSNGIVPATDELFEEIEDNHEKLTRDLADILELKGFVNDTNDENQQELNTIRHNWVTEAEDHSNDLMERAREISRSFQNTKNGAEVALLASTAHKNITEAIETARQSANDALKAVSKSQEELYPQSGQSVIDIGMTSLTKSKEIQKDAIKEIEKLGDLRDILKRQQKVVDTIKNIIWKTGLKNNNISSTVNGMNNNATMKVVSDRLEMSRKVSDQMREVRREAVDISSDVYKLKLKLATLEPNWDTKLGLAQENVSQSLSNIRASNNTLNNMEAMSAKNSDKFREWNNTMSARLQELRDKIAKAKHAAEGIRVSLESKSPKCIRSYIPQMFGLTTANSIKMSIALGGNNENSPLVFVQGDNAKYIAIEMVKRKIRLLWNLGGDTGIVTHPMTIHTRDPKYDDAWYHIEANRTMNLGSLTVRRMHNNGSLTNSQVHSHGTGADHTRFIISAKSRLWIGGIPADIKPRELLADVGLGVVMHQVHVDDKQLGLWHFAHSEGECVGAMLGAQETSSTSNSRHFNGEGYAALSKARSKPYKKNIFFLQITFKTLDENALLFLAVDERNNRSISLTLHEGRIVFRIDYGGESKLEINTTKKFNSGNWVNVEAARQFTPKRNTENGSLKVNNEEPKTGSPTTPITSHMLPDLSDANYYLGGVPPGFKSGTTKAPGADHAYLGCMRDIQIYGESYDPLDSSSFYGIEPSCKDTITIAGFYGNGNVELPSHSLRKRGNFGFVFRTLQPEALIMLSAFPSSISEEFDQKDLRGNYSVSMIQGRVHVWIDAGRGRIELVSNSSYNDGEYHVLSIQKFGRRIELRIDDEFQAVRSFAVAPFVINMPEDMGGLYFGGAPDFPEYDNLAPTFEGFQGAIKDIVFNNRTISYESALNFSNVHIGRSGPPMGMHGLNNVLMKTEPIGKSFTATPEGCHRVGIYSYEPNAFKFGDGQHSHSIINIPTRHLWQKNFNIQFDFRTFYPDGVLFLAPGTKEKQKHFIGLVLRDGQLNVVVRGRKKEELNLPKKLNDGQWHHVSLNSVDKKLTILVQIGMNGQFSTATIKLPKRLNAANMMYIGGISENSVMLPVELISKLEEFKGCIRRFTVNNATQDLARPGRHFNVGQCFPKVEKGSYFPGDAYAIYKKSFHVGKYLELGFEFRTSELNGALLSVSEPVGFPALSIEMNNGKIVMSCDLGDGNPFRVETNNLPSKFALCDNKWHNVSAMYDSEQIALRIDNQASIVALAQHRMSGKVHTKSPLYIGGLPDTAPSGTLLSRENFKGCIRNVVIRNEIKDWTDMDDLHNVLLSECLAIN